MSDHAAGAGAPIADSQADACRCPACSTPFSTGIHQPPARAAFTPGRRLKSHKVCEVWCGDACTCGQGPERASLDPIDVAGMRAVEGRSA